MDRGLSNASLQRVFSVVKVIVNFAIKEQGLQCKNTFAGVYLPLKLTKNDFR